MDTYDENFDISDVYDDENFVRVYDEGDSSTALLRDWTRTGIVRDIRIRRHRRKRVLRMSPRKMLLAASVVTTILWLNSTSTHQVRSSGTLNGLGIFEVAAPAEVDTVDAEIVEITSLYLLHGPSNYVSRPEL